MKSINLKELMTSGRQCGVVVVAAGIIQAFTTPETAVAAAMAIAGGIMVFINCIKPKEEKKE